MLKETRKKKKNYSKDNSVPWEAWGTQKKK